MCLPPTFTVHHTSRAAQRRTTRPATPYFCANFASQSASVFNCASVAPSRSSLQSSTVTCGKRTAHTEEVKTRGHLHPTTSDKGGVQMRPCMPLQMLLMQLLMPDVHYRQLPTQATPSCPLNAILQSCSSFVAVAVVKPATPDLCWAQRKTTAAAVQLRSGSTCCSARNHAVDAAGGAAHVIT